MATEEIRSVLIVDDDEAFRLRLRRAFASRGWEANCAADRSEALTQARQYAPDLILVDLRMPDVDGLDLVSELRGMDDSSRIVVLTGYGSIATALTAVKRGANHYLSKPIDVDQIIAAFEELERGEEHETKPLKTVPSLARVEWEHIQRVLADCAGNVSQAARVLGIHRRSLQRKLTKYPPIR
jgi:two-component system response regulator RegA